MQLPLHLQRFSEPTLILLTDTQEAKFWLAGGDRIEHLDGLALPPERLSDSEGHIRTRDGFISEYSNADAHDTPRKKSFVALIADRIVDYFRDGHITTLIVISPPEMIHLIQQALTPDIVDRISATLEKNLMNEKEVDVLMRLFPV